jgi:ribosomal protein L35
MPRKIGKTGKQKSSSSAKKRARLTGSGKVRMQKAAHNHRLHPKSARQLTLGGRLMVVAGKAARTLKVLLSK